MKNLQKIIKDVALSWYWFALSPWNAAQARRLHALHRIAAPMQIRTLHYFKAYIGLYAFAYTRCAINCCSEQTRCGSVKTKARLSVYLIKCHTVKTCESGGIGVWLHVFLMSALNGREWSGSRSYGLYLPGKEFMVTIEKEAGWRTVWTLQRRESFLSLPWIEPQFSDRSVRSLVTMLILNAQTERAWKGREIYFSAALLSVPLAFRIVAYHHHRRITEMNQYWTSPLRFQDSRTSLSMCNIPSTAVFFFGKQSVDWFPGIPSNYNFFLQLIPVARLATGMTKHFIFHISQFLWLFLYFNCFIASFCIAFLSEGIATSVSKQILPFLF
jgi:hypothetical protein